MPNPEAEASLTTATSQSGMSLVDPFIALYSKDLVLLPCFSTTEHIRLGALYQQSFNCLEILVKAFNVNIVHLPYHSQRAFLA